MPELPLASTLVLFLLVPLASAQKAPFSPGGGQESSAGDLPGSFCGLEETTFSDPDWIMMTSDRIVRASDCLAECEDCQECWYDVAPGAPCYPENRYWRFADEDEVASAFPMSSLGVGTFDGMYVKAGIEVQFYTGSNSENPFGAMQTGPMYASIDYWSVACEGFQPGTFLVSGGAGALGDYSLTLNGGCKGQVRWQDGQAIEGASVTAYALQYSGADIVAVPVGNPEITDSEGEFEVPDGMSTDDFPPLSGELGVTRGVMASITYTEDSGITTERTITNYPFWDPLHPMTGQQTGTEQIFFPFPVIFQPGVSGQYNGGSADGLRGFLTQDPGGPSGAISSSLLRVKQGRGYDSTIPAFLFWGMPSRDVFGPYGSDDVSWGYDNSALQSAASVSSSASRLQLHLLQRVIPELQQFTPGFVAINLTGHSLGGIISRRWVNRYWQIPTLSRYVTFDAVHGGTALVANNFISNLLNEEQMNGMNGLFGGYNPGWNTFNSIPSWTKTLLFASVDETWVIDPSVSAFGIGRIFDQGLVWNSHSGTCLRAVGGWELSVPNRGHSIQNDPEVFVSTGRFLAGYPATLGTQVNPGGSGTAAGFSGPPAALCPAPLQGVPGSAATEFFQLSALSGATTTAPLTPGVVGLAEVSATLVGAGATLTVHDGAGIELSQVGTVTTPIGPDTVTVNFQVDLPAGASELRLNAGASEVLGYVGVIYADGVAASASTDMSVYSAAAPVAIQAYLADLVGNPLVAVGGSAGAEVTLPDTTVVTVPLLDDGASGDGAAGDGVFGGTFGATADSGTYGVVVEVSGDLAGVAHRRMSSATFAVSPTGAAFMGGVTESLVDEDMDTLAEALRFELMISGSENGEYTVRADLMDDGGGVLDVLVGPVEVTAAPELVTATLDLPSRRAWQLGSGGPFTLENIVLVDDDEALVADTRADHLSAAYLLSQFESPPAPVLSRCLPNNDAVSGGDEILLMGEFLGDATGLFVGPSAAPAFTVVGDQTILFTTPPGSEGPTTIRVTTPWNQTTEFGLFRYVPNGEPQIVDPPSAAADCLNDVVSLSVIVSGTAPLTYQWRKEGLDIPGADQATLALTSFGAADFGTYDVVVDNAFGSEVSPPVTLSDCNSTGEFDLCDIELGTSSDCDLNGVPDECDSNGVDCNTNGVFDVCDISTGTSQDCNANGIPDECDLSANTSEDCNSNDVPDECDISTGTSQDCDANGVPDECDPDCNSNGTPDACDLDSGTSQDCNLNSIPDECDLALGTSQDCNANGTPDECDLAGGTSIDCNANGVPDECDLTLGTSQDCDGNGTPDECDISSGSLPDCNSNGIPECPVPGACPCEFSDCNANCVPDDLDISSGTSQDCNANGIPDECDISFGLSVDCNGDGVPDECQTLVRIYVNASASGANDGTSWPDAYTDLESAVQTAEQCSALEKEIWVAAGLYRPSRLLQPGVFRSASFLLLDETGLYGGFTGSESTLAERDPVANPTILDGDLFGGSAPAFHVVSALGVSSNARLDGFVIQAGNAGGPLASDKIGAGLWVEGSIATVANCTFLDNRAELGGAAHVSLGSSLTLEDCDFVGSPGVNGNVATSAGAAIYLADTSSALVSGGTFSGGRSNGGEAGSIFCSPGSTLEASGATFTDNVSNVGGAILADGSSLTLTDSDFVDNRATGTGPSDALGGAILLRGSASAQLAGCEFSENRGTRGGGALHLEGSAVLLLDSSSLLSNSALGGSGGAISVADSASASLRGTYLSDNVAEQGGALWVGPAAGADLTISSLYANIAQVGSGGGIFCEATGLVLDSCALWDNTGSLGTEANQLSVPGGLVSMDYCAVEDWSGALGGTGNIGGLPFDPLFVDSAQGDYHLMGLSPLRDAGNPAFVPLPGEVDYDGEPRVEGSLLDIGCDELTDCNLNLVPDYLDISNGISLDLDSDGIPDECNGDCNSNGVPDVDDISGGTSGDCNSNGIPDECDIVSGASLDVNSNGIPDECESGIVFYVDADATGLADGTSWLDAFTDLQDALDAVDATGASNAQVWIAAGSYVPTRETEPGTLRSSSFSLTPDTNLYGGFAGTETSLDQRDIGANPTILTGLLGAASAYHVLTIDGAGGVEVDGLIVRDGNSNGSGDASRGGGVVIFDSSPTLRNCTLTSNNAVNGGGAFVGAGAAPKLLDSVVSGNTGSTSGAGIRLAAGASLTVRRSTFDGNLAVGDEGAHVYLEPGASLLARSSHWNAGRASRGGAFYLDDAQLDLFDCTLFDNRATGSGASDSLGGSIYARGSSAASLTRCAVLDGRGREGGAVYLTDLATLSLQSSELRGHVATNGYGAGIFAGGSSQTTLRSSYVVDNRATGAVTNGEGGGIYLTGAATADINVSTLVDNGTPDGEGAGIYVSLGTSVQVNSSVLWENRAQNANFGETGQIYFAPGAGAGSTIEYSCVAGWTGGLPATGPGNVGGGSFDPLFVDPLNLDYHLLLSSPCRDLGDPSYVPFLDETDFDGHERVQHGRVDMGFDEASPLDSDRFREDSGLPVLGG